MTKGCIKKKSVEGGEKKCSHPGRIAPSAADFRREDRKREGESMREKNPPPPPPFLLEPSWYHRRAGTGEIGKGVFRKGKKRRAMCRPTNVFLCSAVLRGERKEKREREKPRVVRLDRPVGYLWSLSTFKKRAEKGGRRGARSKERREGEKECDGRPATRRSGIPSSFPLKRESLSPFSQSALFSPSP